MAARSRPLPGGWTRIETDCVTVGLPPPPAPVEGEFRRTGKDWALLARAPAASSASVAAWLRRIGAVDVEPAAGATLRARFGSLPDSIDLLARVARVGRIEVAGDRSLAITVRAPRGSLDALLVTLDTRPYDRDAALTARQEETLQACVAASYYSIPRRITLRAMAQRMGISPTALSLTLRRAEARIVASYVGRKQPVTDSAATPAWLLDRSAAGIVAYGDFAGPAIRPPPTGPE